MHVVSPVRPEDNSATPQAIPLYRGDTINMCPGCGRSQWLVGRIMAQCACCETALPLAQGWRFEGLQTQD